MPILGLLGAGSSFGKYGRAAGSRSEKYLSACSGSGVTYAELVKRLKKHGFKDETEAGITMKLKRGTFSATFFLACLAAMELEGVVLEEI
jgi:hypothetical protein